MDRLSGRSVEEGRLPALSPGAGGGRPASAVSTHNLRGTLGRLFEHPGWELTVGAVTLAAVFGFPAYALVRPAGLSHPAFTAVVVACIVVFGLDWLGRVIAFGSKYVGGLYFWIDGLATVSLVAELPGVMVRFPGVDTGAWPNPRVLRLSASITRLSRLARQSRTALRLGDLLFRSRLGRSRSAAESQATELQWGLEARFNALVALFVVLGLLAVPLHEVFTDRGPLHQAVAELAAAPSSPVAQARLMILRADPSVLRLVDESSGMPMVLVDASGHDLADYEVRRFREGPFEVLISARDERLADARVDIALAAFVVAVMVVMGAAFTRATDRVLIRPLKELRRAVEEAIQRNDALGFLRSVEDAEPVAFLKRVFIPLLERMVAAVNVEARESILHPGRTQLARPRDWAILLTDMQGSTSLMEVLGQQGYAVVNEYFRHCAATLAEFGGDIFEHTGDGFIITVDGEGKEGRAFAMAVRLVEVADSLTASDEWTKLVDHPAWANETLRRVRTRVGVHTGSVMTGRIGNERICRYGLIGEAANLAARLESANKQFGTWVLASQDIARHAPAGLVPRTRRIDRVIVVGSSAPVDIYTFDFAPPPGYPDFRARFDAGLAHYLAGEWVAAREGLADALRLWPADGATAKLVRRMVEIGPVTPEGWTGATKLAQK